MNATTEVMNQEENEAVPVREIRFEPAADVFRDDNGVRVLVDLPGVKESDVDVQLHDGVLTLEGRAHRGDNTLRVYSRSFRVDRRIDTGQIDATVAQGVLTLTLPFRAEAQPRRIAVKAS